VPAEQVACQPSEKHGQPSRRPSRATINKWAAGLADTYVLTRFAEFTCRAVPIAVLPFGNAAFVANPAFTRSVETLRSAGVVVDILMADAADDQGLASARGHLLNPGGPSPGVEVTTVPDVAHLDTIM
jgi:hypothetical protein